MPHLCFFEAGVIGFLQGITELFPVSSLGHSVLIPAVIGGGWARDLNVSAPKSPYLAFIVSLHVATAVALIIYFQRGWICIARGPVTSLRDCEVDTLGQKLGWLLVVAAIPSDLRSTEPYSDRAVHSDVAADQRLSRLRGLTRSLSDQRRSSPWHRASAGQESP